MKSQNISVLKNIFKWFIKIFILSTKCVFRDSMDKKIVKLIVIINFENMTLFESYL